MTAFISITPKDVIVANCLPLVKDKFLMQKQASSEKHEYAKKYYNWSTYYSAIGDYLGFTLGEFEKLGVCVIRELTFLQWQKLFLDQTPVVLLIAHWQDSHTKNAMCVEFSDGFINIEEIVACIPHNREMILDLCVCHPIPLMELIEKSRPNVRIVYRDVGVYPHQWLLIYSVAFQELAAESTDYVTAIEKAITDLSTCEE